MSTIDIQYPQILDECVTHLQDGSMSLESCLAQYPLYADQLRRDLALFQLTQQITAPKLKSQSVDALEAKLLATFDRASTQPKRQSQPTRPKPTRMRQATMPITRWVAGFAIAFMLLVGAGGGTVMASANSLPGDSLYGVKIAWEQVVIFVASLFGDLDDVWLRLTQTRAEEVMRLYDAGQLNQDVIDTFYITAETAILYASDDTEQAYLQLADEIRPIFSEAILLSMTEADQLRILRVLSPEIDANGQLTMPAGETFLPPVDVQEATATPTLEPTATLTWTPTFTASPTPTVTATSEPTATRTPTPSRTPTLEPSVTPTLTHTSVPPSPTATWTPLGIQPRGEEVTVESDTGQQVDANPRATRPVLTGDNEYFIRETELAVEITQTALAQTPTSTPSG